MLESACEGCRAFSKEKLLKLCPSGGDRLGGEGRKAVHVTLRLDQPPLLPAYVAATSWAPNPGHPQGNSAKPWSLTRGNQLAKAQEPKEEEAWAATDADKGPPRGQLTPRVTESRPGSCHPSQSGAGHG